MERIKQITASLAALAMIMSLALPALVGTAAAASYTVSGTVTDSTDSGIGNATVTVLQNGTVVDETTTASDGSYSVSNISSGNYTVEIAKPGYATFTETVDVSSDKTVNVQLGVESIGGMVVDESDTGLDGVNVTLVDPSTGDVVTTVTTASDGSYTVTPPEPGSWTVQTEPEGYLMASTTLDTTSTTSAMLTAQSDSDGDGIADSSDAYPTHAKQEYTVGVNDSKTPDSVYAELNASTETTITVDAKVNGSWTQVNQTTETPNSTPKVVEIDVSNYSDATEYRVTTHGQDASDTGVFYESDSGSGGTGGDDGDSLPVRVEVLVAGIVVAGAALALADW